MTIPTALVPPVAGEAGDRAADAITSELVQRITSGVMAVGSRLPTERELMREFSVSRVVVREAIAHLASQRLVSSRRGFRPVIQRPDSGSAFAVLGDLVGHLLREPDGVRNLFESRMFVEASLARHAARHAERADIEALRMALAANEAALGDPQAFYDSDVALHAVLYRIPGNPIYPVIHRAFVEWLMNHWRQMRSSPEIDSTLR